MPDTKLQEAHYRKVYELYKARESLNENELSHAKHKYIKREMVNGKWRYWYDEPKETLAPDVNGGAPDTPAQTIQYQVETALKELPQLGNIKTAEEAAEVLSRTGELIDTLRRELEKYERHAKSNATNKAAGEALNKELSKASDEIYKLEKYYRDVNSVQDSMEKKTTTASLPNKKKATPRKLTGVTAVPAKGKAWLDKMFNIH